MNRAEQTRASYIDQLLSFWMNINNPNHPKRPVIGTNKCHTLCMCRSEVWQNKPLYGLVDNTDVNHVNKPLRPLDEYICLVTKILSGTKQNLWNLALSKPIYDWTKTVKFKDLDAEISFATDIPSAATINAPGGIVTVRNVRLGDDVAIELTEHGFARFNWTDYMLFL